MGFCFEFVLSLICVQIWEIRVCIVEILKMRKWQIGVIMSTVQSMEIGMEMKSIRMESMRPYCDCQISKLQAFSLCVSFCKWKKNSWSCVDEQSIAFMRFTAMHM
ncbi:hypothetical protein Droror1_Dr00027471 [Drosera rotundifolia]